MYKSFYLMVFICLLTSCNGQKKAVENKVFQNDKKMELVDQNSYSGVDSTETMVIASAKALKSFYSRINRTRKPGLPVPEIDFSKNLVVILCSSDDNYVDEERLSVLNETATEIVLGMSKVTKNNNQASSSVQESQVSPFFVYKMPLTDKKVSFKPME